MGKTLEAFIEQVAIDAGPHVIAWTTENQHALCAWAWAEGSNAEWNPWDTTLYVPNAKPYNTFNGGDHVWDYACENDGIWAFLATLKQPKLGGFAPIRAALADGTNPYEVEYAVSNSGWGTEAFRSILDEVIANPAHYLAREVVGN